MGIYKVVNRIKMSEAGEENEVPQIAEEEEKADNIKDALKMVIKKSQANDGLVKGLNEVCKCLDRKQAILCILAEDCNDPKYKKLVDALAKSSNVPLIEVEKRDDLGEWLGHCKYDIEGKARRVKGTSSVAITNYGEESEALSFVLNYIRKRDLATEAEARRIETSAKRPPSDCRL